MKKNIGASIRLMFSILLVVVAFLLFVTSDSPTRGFSVTAMIRNIFLISGLLGILLNTLAIKKNG